MNFNPINAAATSGGSSILMIVYIVVIIGAMYFLLIRPQRKRTKEEKQLRESIQVGDEIVTIGGIYGRIISLKEETIIIESKSDHSKLTIARWAIQTNLTPHSNTEKPTTVNGKRVRVQDSKDVKADK